MTEPQPLPAESAAPGVHEAMGLLQLPARARTYWDSVWRAFARGYLNRMASGWVALIVLVAVFVPLLANDAPYTAVMDGKRTYPLFRDLTRVDWIIFVVALCGSIYTWVHYRLARYAVSIEDLRHRRFVWILVMAGLAFSASLNIWTFRHDFLDRNDYHALAREGKLTEAVFAPLRWSFADQEPLEADLTFQMPSHNHALGTDGNGRDALARLLWGARVVLAIGFVSEIIALIIGIFYGALMGYFVGTVDILGMRFVEIVEAIPTLFLLITFVALYGRNLFMLMVILGVTGWTPIARFVRAEFLRIRQLDYVTAARAAGLPLPSILFRHMLPNGLTPVIITFTFGVAANIASESILSFLGIGVTPPTPSWGAMLNEAGNPAETFRWWLAISPGLLIFLTVFAYNIIGEGLRDAIDPRLNKAE